ncbi:MAG: T9SS type A sorting domain-containing protein [Flavobacteriales bacterium]|nr:T9SS type A sorting domain-containing protein [Flavobacteriales bacterium]
MYRSFLISLAVAAAFHAQAQSVTHRVLVLNEGYYDFGGGGQLVPVSLGAFDPSTGTYGTVAVIEGPRFGSDLLVHAGSIYVAADDRVLRYDLESYTLLASAEVIGVRKLAVWNDRLLLTRGELGGLPHYFEAREIASLDLVQAITPADGLPYAVEDVLVVGDLAYLAVGNAFEWGNMQGRIGIVDLPTMSYTGEVDLGPQGLNPEKLMLHDGDILAFNNKDFSTSSISRVNTVDASLTYTVDVTVNSSCAASARVEANALVYFMEYAQNELARFDPTSGAVADTLTGSPAIYGLLEDPINGVLYGTTTDFFSTGALHVMSLQGEVLSTVAVGVAPGNLALDIRQATSVPDRASAAPRVFPNPATDLVSVSGTAVKAGQWIAIHDSMGRRVMEQQVRTDGQQSLELTGLAQGAYVLRVGEGPGSRFIKH